MFLHIRMTSEGSCDTEDWSNDAENSALINILIENTVTLYFTMSLLQLLCSSINYA